MEEEETEISDLLDTEMKGYYKLRAAICEDETDECSDVQNGNTHI